MSSFNRSATVASTIHCSGLSLISNTDCHRRPPLNMRMLAPEEESDDAPEVTWEDQQKINKFSKLNARLRGIEDIYQKLKQDKEVLDDLSTELELVDEDELVLYRVGETFLHLPLIKAQEQLEQDQKSISSELDEIQKKVDECEVTMKTLKIELYTKFGSSINLDA